MDIRQFNKVFPLGAHLCREPMPPMSELKRDMGILKSNGFNLIKLQEHWAMDEPEEGKYDFSKYEELIGYAGKLDMGVYLGLTMEQAPPWLWEKHPDCRMEGELGLPISYEAQATLPFDGKPGPCFDHPDALADQLRFISKVVQTLGAHENIVVWNTWQEIGYASETTSGQMVCYCPNTFAFFRKWLMERYGDLDGLNRAWNTRYAQWKYVAPDRLKKTGTGIFSKGCLPQDVDWKYFLENIRLAKILKDRADTIKQADPFKRPVFAHEAVPSIGPGSYWSLAKSQDFLGTSAYPTWCISNPWDDDKPVKGRFPDKHKALLVEMLDGLAMRFDYTRSWNRRGAPVWAAEFQGGPVNFGAHRGRVPSAEDMRRWILTAIASGFTAICFWVARAEIMAQEANGFSLLDSVGDSTERFREVSRIGRALNRHADLFSQPNLKSAQVAILLNDWNYRICDSIPMFTEHLAYSVRGFYKLLWEAGATVDFLEASQLDGESENAYKMIFMPFPLSISEELAGRLDSYVSQGGNLVSELCPGRLNEHAFANRGELSPVLSDLFGVKHESLTMVSEPNDGMRWSEAEWGFGEYLDDTTLKGIGELDGCSVRANVYMETFQCTDSQPVLRYGSKTAGTCRHSGQGTAWLIGTFAGHNGTAYVTVETEEYMTRLLCCCGVVPEKHGRLLLRKRTMKNKQAWIFINLEKDGVSETVDVSGWDKVEDLFGELKAVDNGCVAVNVKSMDVCILILESER